VEGEGKGRRVGEKGRREYRGLEMGIGGREIGRGEGERE
jgi:hypothetical protein